MVVPAERAPAALAPGPRRGRRGPAGRRPGPLRARLEYPLLRAIVGTLGLLPLWFALRLGEIGAFLVYLLDAPHRRIGMRNLALAFPDRPLGARRRILRRSFLNLGRMAAEPAHLPRLSGARLRGVGRCEGGGWWKEAVGCERSTGGLVLCGHFGSWGLLVYARGRRGFPVHMVHRAIASPLVDRWLNALRARAGTRMIRKSTGAGGV